MHPELRGAAGGHPKVGGISDDPRKNGFGKPPEFSFPFVVPPLGTPCLGYRSRLDVLKGNRCMQTGWLRMEGK